MQAFLMSGMGASFRPAGACPVMRGPHAAPDAAGSFMAADAATADGTAGARLVLWRCRFCGAQLTGLGRLGEDADTQEFTWLEAAAVPLLASTPAAVTEEPDCVTKTLTDAIDDIIYEHTEGGGGSGLAAVEIVSRLPELLAPAAVTEETAS